MKITFVVAGVVLLLLVLGVAADPCPKCGETCYCSNNNIFRGKLLNSIRNPNYGPGGVGYGYRANSGIGNEIFANPRLRYVYKSTPVLVPQATELPAQSAPSSSVSPSSSSGPSTLSGLSAPGQSYLVSTPVQTVQVPSGQASSSILGPVNAIPIRSSLGTSSSGTTPISYGSGYPESLFSAGSSSGSSLGPNCFPGLHYQLPNRAGSAGYGHPYGAGYGYGHPYTTAQLPYGSGQPQLQPSPLQYVQQNPTYPMVYAPAQAPHSALVFESVPAVAMPGNLQQPAQFTTPAQSSGQIPNTVNQPVGQVVTSNDQGVFAGSGANGYPVGYPVLYRPAGSSDQGTPAGVPSGSYVQVPAPANQVVYKQISGPANVVVQPAAKTAVPAAGSGGAGTTCVDYGSGTAFEPSSGSFSSRPSHFEDFDEGLPAGYTAETYDSPALCEC